MLHIPSTFVRHSGLAPSSKAPRKLPPRVTSHTLVRHSGLAPSCGAPPKLFPRFTPHPRSSSTPVALLPAELPPSYFHASRPMRIRPALQSRSSQRSSPQVISTLPSFLSSLLPSFLPSLLPSFPPSFLPSSLAPPALLSRFFRVEVN